MYKLILLTLLCCFQLSAEIDFNTEIRPILSEYCFHCHGPDNENREGKLRLDITDGKYGAYRNRKGRFGILPKESNESHVYLRMITEDEDDIMPPLDSKKVMKPEEIDIIKQWIDQGAKYDQHWAFKKPVSKKLNSTKNPVDFFIQKKLQELKLPSSKPTNEENLIRRLYLDLTGMPPKTSEIDSFLTNTHPQKYEQLIDHIFQSNAFAERMTLEWLDLARYADTNGFSIDDHRDMWAWRDWVLKAFKENKPYNEFIIEQIAGDLLPDPTDDQKIATGFLRNSMNTHEGGTIPEEYRVNYTVDKLDTVSTTFMALTVKCAQCHDHKYDPISQKSFFELYAFFNKSTEPGKGAINGNTKPFIQVNSSLTDKDKMTASYKDRINELTKHKEFIAKEKTYLSYDSKIAIKTIDTEIEVLQKQIHSGKTSAMIMDDSSDRKTFILDRGQYNKPTVEVHANVLEEIFPFDSQLPKNRLGLAKWLTDKNHPLTSRVAVNRLWQMIFNRGLVETSEDFGSQGSTPTHPQLLDHLSLKFTENNWDVRKLLKVILLSETYKQESIITKSSKEIDPNNKYYSYAPNFRLKAEFIRDSAFKVSGLLNSDFAGPSVYPPQPKALWAQVSHFGHKTSFTTQAYFPSFGKNQYTRSIYSVIKRTSANPSLTTFDAPNRETCVSRRQSTNTPTQALVTLNDPQFVHAAEVLALKYSDTSESIEKKLSHIFRDVLSRYPTKKETNILKKAYAQQLTFYKENKPLIKYESAETTALSILCSTIMNLSENLTRK